MAIQDDFAAAQEDVKTLTKRPSDMELLQLYALFKQATVGDVQGKKPGMFDLKAKAKYDMWSKQKGTSSEDAMQKYIDLVKKLGGKYK